MLVVVIKRYRTARRYVSIKHYHFLIEASSYASLSLSRHNLFPFILILIMFICFLITYVRCLIQSQIVVIIFCGHGASEGLLILGEGGRYKSVKQNDSDVFDDGEFFELCLFHANIEVALHNSIFYFSFII